MEQAAEIHQACQQLGVALSRLQESATPDQEPHLNAARNAVQAILGTLPYDGGGAEAAAAAAEEAGSGDGGGGSALGGPTDGGGAEEHLDRT